MRKQHFDLCTLFNYFDAPFVVRTLDPGQLTIKFLKATVAAVSGTAAVWVGDHLPTDSTPAWYRQNNGSPYALAAISSTLRAMRTLHHGGALIVVPKDGSWRDSTYTDMLYSGEDHFTGVHEALSELEQARSKQDLEDIVDRDEVKRNSAMVSWWYRRLEEASADLAQLTAVDGATVMTKDLVILGFGVKLKSTHAENAPPIYVTDLLDPSKRNAPSSLNELGATRHQSAALFIAEQHEATALVVSQDGNISALTWHEPGQVAGVTESGVYVYRHLELTL